MKKFKVTTRAGAERKRNRLMVEMLARRYPEIFEDLQHLAIREIVADNESLTAEVNTWGLGSVKKPSKQIVNTVISTHENRVRAAYGDEDVNLKSSKVARLLQKV